MRAVQREPPRVHRLPAPLGRLPLRASSNARSCCAPRTLWASRPCCRLSRAMQRCTQARTCRSAFKATFQHPTRRSASSAPTEIRWRRKINHRRPAAASARTLTTAQRLARSIRLSVLLGSTPSPLAGTTTRHCRSCSAQTYFRSFDRTWCVSVPARAQSIQAPRMLLT